MSGTPFTNSIAVGTEAVADVWPGLRAVEQSVLLCQVLVVGARPNPGRMAERAEQGFTTATAVADRLVGQGVPFRTAHRMVGDAVRRAIDAGTTRLDDVGLDGLAASEVVRSLTHGGGPGAFVGIFDGAVTGWRDHLQWHQDWRRSVAAADAELAAAVASLCEAA
jgi:argininosuccinate lyase